MSTDKELADAYRLVAGDYYQHDISATTRAGSFTNACRKIADEFDPPAPVYPDGTIAYVTTPINAKFLMRYDADLDQWVNSWGAFGAGMTKGPADVTKVEPLRVLADDEIAIPRTAILSNDGVAPTAELIRSWSFLHQWTRRVASAIADALAAEAGDVR